LSNTELHILSAIKAVLMTTPVLNIFPLF